MAACRVLLDTATGYKPKNPDAIVKQEKDVLGEFPEQKLG
jgi:hypothetical protein